MLATGRRYSHTLHLVEPLKIGVPIVTASGALVKDPATHETIFKTEFDRKLLCDLLATLDRAGYDGLLNGDTFAAGFDFYQPPELRENRYLAEYLALNHGCGRTWPDFIAAPPPEIFAGFTMGTREEMLAVEQLLQAALPGKLTTHVLRSPKYSGFMCEIAPAGVTKWSGIRRLAAGWGIADEEICRGWRRRERHSHDSRRRHGCGDGQRRARSNRRSRPHRPDARPRRLGRGGVVALGVTQ